MKYFSVFESGKPLLRSQAEEQSKSSVLRNTPVLNLVSIWPKKDELTTPYTPQRNGAAERLNRTLVEGVRTMLADSKLSHRFWAEALSTCAYLRNRSPTKALEGITPYEAWSGGKPDASLL